MLVSREMSEFTVVRDPGVQVALSASGRDSKAREGTLFRKKTTAKVKKTSKGQKPKEVSQSTWLIPKGSGEIFAAKKSLRKAI